MIKNILLMVTLLLTPLTYAHANNKIIDEIQESYADLDSFKADFTQELFHRESQHTKQTSGEFSFKKDALIRFETTEPQEELLVINEDAIWNYIPFEEIAYKYNAELAKKSNNILSVITGKSPLSTDFDYEVIENLMLDTKKVDYIKLYPLQPTVELTEAEIWVDRKTSLIIAVKVFDFYGNTNYIKFSDVKTNVKLNDSFFEFEPPKGIDVEDHSDSNSMNIQGLTE